MADDIDDLLREVEEKYLPNHSISDKNSHLNSKATGITLPKMTESHPVGKSDGLPDKIAGTITSKPTVRAHSSDIICHELEDDLSDLLDDDGRMSDAALVSLRCKRSPRRSASARDLMVNNQKVVTSSAILDDKSNARSSSSSAGPLTGTGNRDGMSNNGVTNTVLSHHHSSSFGSTGTRSAPPASVHHHQSADSFNIQRTSSTITTGSKATIEKQKCFPIYLSGVIDSIEANQTVRVCNSLRCTGCDFRVSQFAHYRWRPGVDYLFLRNHMPEFDRVRVKLATAKFSRAYGCQCKFVTIKDLIDLNKLGPEFASKWICLGH